MVILDRQIFDVQITAGTTNNVWTLATTADDQEIDIDVIALGRAAAETAGYHKKASFEVRSGTLAQVGATQDVAPDREDDATWNLTVDQSAGSIRVRGTADGTNATNFAGVVQITQRKA